MANNDDMWNKNIGLNDIKKRILSRPENRPDDNGTKGLFLKVKKEDIDECERIINGGDQSVTSDNNYEVNNYDKQNNEQQCSNVSYNAQSFGSLTNVSDQHAGQSMTTRANQTCDPITGKPTFGGLQTDKLSQQNFSPEPNMSTAVLQNGYINQSQMLINKSSVEQPKNEVHFPDKLH